MTPDSEGPDAGSSLLFFSDSVLPLEGLCGLQASSPYRGLQVWEAALPAFLTEEEALFIHMSKRARDRSSSPPTSPD